MARLAGATDAAPRTMAAAAHAARRLGRENTPLPGWKELDRSSNRRARADAAGAAGWSTRKAAAIIFASAAALTLYVGHVHATQQLLEEVRAARAENHRLYLRYNRAKGAFDRATSPAVIARRARALGLAEAAPPAATIRVRNR